MKKVIFTLITVFFFNSCSKDEPETTSPPQEQGVSAIKLYNDDDTKPYNEVITDNNNKIIKILYHSTPTMSFSTDATNYIYTNNLVTQYYYISNNIKNATDIEYLTDGRLSKVTSTKGNTITSIITYNYDDVTGKTTSKSDIYTNGVITITVNSEYEFSNGNLVTNISNDGTTITTRKYEYDPNTTNNKNIYSKIVGFDKLFFDREFSNTNPYTKATVIEQDATTLVVKGKRNYKQTITYNQNLFPIKIENFYSTNDNPLTNSGFERIEYQ